MVGSAADNKDKKKRAQRAHGGKGGDKGLRHFSMKARLPTWLAFSLLLSFCHEPFAPSLRSPCSKPVPLGARGSAPRSPLPHALRLAAGWR